MCAGYGVTLVWTYYIDKGRRLRDKGITRGNHLVRTEEEWRERYDRMLTKPLGSASEDSYVLITIIIFFPLMLIIFLIASGPARDAMIFFLVLLLFISIIIPVTVVFLQRRVIRKLPAAGLYDYGIQQTHVIFIPYQEIARIEMSARGWPKKREVMLLHPRYERILAYGIKTKMPYVILVEFLGLEGAKELEERVRGGTGPIGPPDLHLYGTYK